MLMLHVKHIDTSFKETRKYYNLINCKNKCWINVSHETLYNHSDYINDVLKGKNWKYNVSRVTYTKNNVSRETN